MRYLLDTDTCVDLLRGVTTVLQKLASIAPDDCSISTITSFELFAGAAGARDPRRESEKIQRLLEVVKEVPFEAKTARRAGKLRMELERMGGRIGPYDLLIAAQAQSLDLILVTTNEREFGRVKDLQVESWR